MSPAAFAIKDGIKRLSQQGECADGLETGDSHQDAQEEEDGVHVDA